MYSNIVREKYQLHSPLGYTMFNPNPKTVAAIGLVKKFKTKWEIK